MRSLTPAIVQDADDGRVLMLAWMDEEALRRTRETGEAWFWSRSREQLWHKGETSGNTLAVESSSATTATATRSSLRVRPERPRLPHRLALVLRALALAPRRRARQERPEGSYVAGLLDEGAAAAARKVGEEGVEAALAGRDGERRAPRRGARRPLVPQLRPARRPRARPGARSRTSSRRRAR